MEEVNGFLKEDYFHNNTLYKWEELKRETVYRKLGRGSCFQTRRLPTHL